MIKPVNGRIQVSDIIDRIDELDDELEELNEECMDCTENEKEQKIYDWNEENKDEYDELIELQELIRDTPTWENDGELIDSFYFDDVIKDQYDEYIHDILENVPYFIKDHISINWEGIADNIATNEYFEVEYNGRTYLVEA